MGEYATNPRNGQRIKLGTCEDLFYVTAADLAALAAAGWKGDGCDLAEYIENPAFRCRLPKPDDVPGDVSTIEARDYNTGPRYRVDLSERVAKVVRNEVDHGDLHIHKGGINVFVPCPMGKTPGRISAGFVAHAYLVAQGMGDGRAVYQCPWCEHKFNLKGSPVQGELCAAFDAAYPNRGEPWESLRQLVRAGLVEVAAV